MSILFRLHRGGLAESMETQKEVDTIAEMEAYVKENCGFMIGDPDIHIVEFINYGADERIGWESCYMVLAILIETNENQSVSKYAFPVGFSNGILT